MITLLNAETNEVIGEITRAQLDFLIKDLEEESADDRDYYINADTLDFFVRDGVDAQLVALLRKALGDSPDMDIRWKIS